MADLSKMLADIDEMVQSRLEYIRELEQALTAYDDAGRKFIDKVESGRASSKETYKELCDARDLAAPLLQKKEDSDD